MKWKRRHLILGLLGVLTTVGVGSKTRDVLANSEEVIDVATVEELVNAMGDNRTIRLNASVFDLSNLNSTLPHRHISLTDNTLTIFGVNNLRIIANRSIIGIPSIITPNPDSPVIRFNQCRNLTLQGIELGHYPQKGQSCSAAVLDFEDCEGITIRDCILFGSGTHGIIATDVRNMGVKDSVIKECTRGIMSLSDSSSCFFEGCQFYENQTDIGNLIEITYFDEWEPEGNSVLAQFSQCEFFDNVTSHPSSLFWFWNEIDQIIVENCTIRNNRGGYLASNPNLVKLINCQIDNNTWTEIDDFANVDYTQLEKLLAAKNWREADQETLRLMLAVSGGEADNDIIPILGTNALHVPEVNHFPCAVLNRIDELWSTYSNGQFGISIQMQLYQELGGTEYDNLDRWWEFVKRVGWGVDIPPTFGATREWFFFNQLIFNQTAPPGHFPYLSTLALGQGSFPESFLVRKLMSCQL